MSKLKSTLISLAAGAFAAGAIAVTPMAGNAVVVKTEAPAVVVKTQAPNKVIKTMPTGVLCDRTGLCGVVRVAPGSRRSATVVKNWLWAGNDWVTEKSVAANNKLYVPPGHWSSEYWKDADGFIAPAGCTTYITKASISGRPYTSVWGSGKAYKLQDGHVVLAISIHDC